MFEEMSVCSVISLLLFLLVGSIVHGRKENENILEGRHLVIATLALHPYMYFERTDSGNITQVDGLVYQMINWLSFHYKFTYSFVTPSDGLFGALVDDQWNGMVRMITEQEADLIAFALSPTEDRSTVLDFTVPFLEESLAALIPAPAEGHRLGAIVHSFQLEVWILVLFSLVSVSLATWLIAKITNHSNRFNASQQQDLNLSFIFFLGIMCFQARNPVPGSELLTHSTRITAGFWCLSAVVIISMYNSELKSSLTAPKLYPRAETLEDLANSSQLQVITFQSHFFESIILNAQSGSHKKLGDSIRQHPENRLSQEYISDFDKLSLRMSENSALIIENNFLDDLIEYHTNKIGRCNFVLMKERFILTWESFALPKGSPYLPLINQGINIMREKGYLDHWIQTYMKKKDGCRSDVDEDSIAKSSLTELVGVFLLLLIGILLAAIVLIVEKIIHRLKTAQVAKVIVV